MSKGNPWVPRGIVSADMQVCHYNMAKRASFYAENDTKSPAVAVAHCYICMRACVRVKVLRTTCAVIVEASCQEKWHCIRHIIIIIAMSRGQDGNSHKQCPLTDIGRVTGMLGGA